MVSTSLPQDVPGNVEVFVQNTPISDDDSSDEEPLAAKRLRIRQQGGVPTWRKFDTISSYTPEEVTEIDQRKQFVKEALKDLNPVQIFEKIFDEEVYKLVISSTNLYNDIMQRVQFAKIE
ncbi:uncharacterized protein LOC106134143 [Amyelois transitella]|uniref:uncharacterized protein LOC106134143 n=1 Tax=Amyelois transitella TaxID=680683 RepID=UPI00299017CF|nr:uncharacterized protein LOC106134143 [Amyelois transitella]